MDGGDPYREFYRDLLGIQRDLGDLKTLVKEKAPHSELSLVLKRAEEVSDLADKRLFDRINATIEKLESDMNEAVGRVEKQTIVNHEKVSEALQRLQSVHTDLQALTTAVEGVQSGLSRIHNGVFEWGWRIILAGLLLVLGADNALEAFL